MKMQILSTQPGLKRKCLIFFKKNVYFFLIWHHFMIAALHCVPRRLCCSPRSPNCGFCCRSKSRFCHGNIYCQSPLPHINLAHLICSLFGSQCGTRSAGSASPCGGKKNPGSFVLNATFILFSSIKRTFIKVKRHQTRSSAMQEMSGLRDKSCNNSVSHVCRVCCDRFPHFILFT